MGTNVIREKRRIKILLTLSIAFAAIFMVSFISQTAELARLQRWHQDLMHDISDLERQRAELDAEIALRKTDAWLSQAAVEAGLLPPNAYAVQVADEPAPQAQAPSATPTMAAERASAPGSELPSGAAWDNPNWRAWRRLLTGRP